MLAPLASAQPRPYIGYVYPAGGQQGTTVQVRLGGQVLDDLTGVLVTGPGVTARVTDYYRRLSFQDLQLLNDQARMLRRETMSAAGRARLRAAESTNTLSDNLVMMSQASTDTDSETPAKESVQQLLSRIEARTQAFVPLPASDALASLAMVEVALAPGASPGRREMRLVTRRGVSNPLPFYVGQLPEFSRKPMQTQPKQVLGKESQALPRRLPGEDEERITVPCTVNGQIGSSEVNRYRFEARRGQRLVITTLGRQLVPFIADAVPGWFQPVLAVYDAKGKEVAYDDDFRFNPDPTLYYEVPKDGEYVFTIRDSIYRGREDFVYRITIGEVPFITSLFPLGGRAGAPFRPKPAGWNLEGAELEPVTAETGPGLHQLAAVRKGLVSNRVPFALNELPEAFDQEPNNTPARAQRVTLPVIINGRIDKPDDWDVFQFTGHSNQTIVAEVMARRLDSPLDSVLKLTDAAGRLLAFNDDHEDLTAGLNTHPADSYLMVRLPADGTYYVHIGDTPQQGGLEYGYRLRLSAPRPDFDLRVVPSSLALRAKSSGVLTVYAQRKDGFAGPIKLTLKDPPPGFAANPVTLGPTQTVARLVLKTTLLSTTEPVSLSVIGTAKPALSLSHLQSSPRIQKAPRKSGMDGGEGQKGGGQELTRAAVPAEDRMQAFLWRHLVPAEDLKVLVFDPSYQPPSRRTPPPLALTAPAATNALASATPTAATNAPSGTNAVAAVNKPKFSKQQVVYRLRELKLLYEEGLLTDAFYTDKVAECAAAE